LETVRKIAKSSLVMFTVGALLALAAPPLAVLAGIDPGMLGPTTNMLWSGAFFGAFGGIRAALAPAMDWVFGDKEPSGAQRAASPVQTPAPGCDVAIHSVRVNQVVDTCQDVELTQKPTSYTTLVAPQRHQRTFPEPLADPSQASGPHSAPVLENKTGQHEPTPAQTRLCQRFLF
jgi:hypothetical protein